MRPLAGKTALVLGCGGEGNIGQAVARRLTDDGARVMVSARRPGEADALAAEIGGAAGHADITSRASVLALVGRAVEVLGGLDIAVQSTGEGYLERFLDNSEEALERLTRLQFLGPFYFLQATIPAVRQGGSIVTLSSVTAKIAINDHAVYQGTKAGIDHVVRCLAAEFGPRGIRINAVAPGPTPTPMTAGLKVILERAAGRSPMRRLGTPAEVAAAVAFLARDDCFLTGEVLQANGGYGLVGAPVEAR